MTKTKGLTIFLALFVPLALLYRITTKIPWYGGMLIVFQWLIYVSVLYSAYSRCRKWFHLIPVTVLTSCFFLAYYYMVGLIQYTSTAAMLASAGYACLLLQKNKKVGYSLFLGLNLFGFLLRSQAMLLVQPLGVAAVSVVLIDKNAAWKEMAKKMLFVTVGVVFVLCLGMVGNQFGYHSKEWKRYTQFYNMRIELFDFYGTPDYEEVHDILEEYQISEKKYEAFCRYMILDWTENAECDKRLKSYVVDSGKRQISLGKLLKRVYELSITELQWNMKYTTITAWAMFLLWMVLRRNWKQLVIGGVLLGGARTAVWAYLAWGGRTPARVTFPLLACEVLLLLSLVWRDCQETETVYWKKVILILGGVLFCMVSISTGRQQSRYIGEVNRGQQIYMEGLREIMAYCQSNSENRYLIDSESLKYYSGSVFDTSVYHPVNAVISGGWFSNMPTVQQKLEDYLGSAEGFYFLTYVYGNQEEMPAFTYLVEEMGEKPKFVEQWTASHGGNYAVYYFEGAFPFS